MNKDRTISEAALRRLQRKSEGKKLRLARRIIKTMTKMKKLYPVPPVPKIKTNE